MNMGQESVSKPRKEKPKMEIVWVPVEGDIIDAICEAIQPNVSSVLAKHGAKLKISLNDYIRNHLKV